MCGIAGIVGFKDSLNAESRLKKMLTSLSRRGPDGEGIEVWTESKVALGHRRLSIFDLSEAGRQPMLSPDSQIGIVFNGAIYNFRFLRVELEKLGYEFLSQTDTEVLIHGYKEWGIDQLVSKIRGMFAFGLWDNQRRKFFLVRDRLGVKPLFFSVKDKQLVFASTARALCSGGFADEIDKGAIAEFLEFGYVTDQRAIYRGVEKLQAAEILEWCDEEIKTRSYWSLPSVDDNSKLTFNDAVEETEKIFLRAVERRLDADVPVGSLLSGGVDSSLVCWAIKELGGDITAFTIGTPGDVLDETSDAKATAKKLGINHSVLEMSSDEEPSIDEMISAYGEPFACASALGMLRVSRAVRNEATVLLTGDGGDDVFLGYPEHKHFLMAQKLANKLPKVTASLWKQTNGLLPRKGFLKRAVSFADYTTGGLGAVTNAHDGLPMYKRNGMLGERLVDVNVRHRSIERSFDSARKVLEDFLQHDLHGRFVGEYLVKVDGATMRHSLEARSPFLDQELWEFASQLPFDLRLQNGISKAILRELARRRIGEEVASGVKRGFGVPVQRWITGRWRERVETVLRDSVLEKEGWIKSKPTLEQLEKASKNNWSPKQLWYIYVLENWLRQEKESLNADILSALNAQREQRTNPQGVFQ